LLISARGRAAAAGDSDTHRVSLVEQTDIVAARRRDREATRRVARRVDAEQPAPPEATTKGRLLCKDALNVRVGVDRTVLMGCSDRPRAAGPAASQLHQRQ
jgi:hypothetical protein